MIQTKSSRCAWVTGDPFYMDYHDHEWGRPVFEERHLFEMLILEGAQAGLSWITILRRRESYREAFLDFDPALLSKMGPEDVERLMQNSGIIRHRRKIVSAINNAKAWQALKVTGSPVDFLWECVGGEPRLNDFKDAGEVPSETKESRALSQALKKAGFSFVGPTICYAFMQAVGMVNDHTQDCSLYHGKA